MELRVVSSDVVALAVNSTASGEEILSAVRSALCMSGYTPWRDMEVEAYTYGDCALIIARPAPPLTCRVQDVPRLRRS